MLLYYVESDFCRHALMLTLLRGNFKGTGAGESLGATMPTGLCDLKFCDALHMLLVSVSLTTNCVTCSSLDKLKKKSCLPSMSQIAVVIKIVYDAEYRNHLMISTDYDAMFDCKYKHNEQSKIFSSALKFVAAKLYTMDDIRQLLLKSCEWPCKCYGYIVCQHSHGLFVP